jgi:hypothetical protein
LKLKPITVSFLLQASIFFTSTPKIVSFLVFIVPMVHLPPLLLLSLQQLLLAETLSSQLLFLIYLLIVLTEVGLQ